LYISQKTNSTQKLKSIHLKGAGVTVLTASQALTQVTIKVNQSHNTPMEAKGGEEI
jgi:hypothetical protein